MNFNMDWIYIVFTSIISLVFAQIDDILQTSTVLPRNVQRYFTETGLRDIQDRYVGILKKKCFKNSNKEFDDILQANAVLFISCMSSWIDVDTLLEEIDDTDAANIRYDLVLKKYCDKTPQFKKCFYDMIGSLEPCFSAEERKHYQIVYDITDQVIEFLCYNNGDRIAFFITEGGDYCYKDKQEKMFACFNDIFNLWPQSEVNIDDFINLVIEDKQCNQMTSLQKCIVGILETCDKPSSASLTELLFKTVRKAMPCKSLTEGTLSSAGSCMVITSSIFSISLINTLLI